MCCVANNINLHLYMLKVRRCGVLVGRARGRRSTVRPRARAAGAHTGFRPSNILCGVWGDFMSRRMQSETRKGLVCGTRFFHPYVFACRASPRESICSPRAHPAGGGWASKPATATCTVTQVPSLVPTGASRRRPTTTGESRCSADCTHTATACFAAHLRACCAVGGASADAAISVWAERPLPPRPSPRCKPRGVPIDSLARHGRRARLS